MSKDPNNRVLGPKYYNIIGIWALKPYYLGPWTLRVSTLIDGGNHTTQSMKHLSWRSAQFNGKLQDLGCIGP